MQATDVVGDGGQHPFGVYRRQSAPVESSHPALLFQNPEHRFHYRLSSLIHPPSCLAAQFLTHAPMIWIANHVHPIPRAGFPVRHLVSQVLVWQIGVDAAFAAFP